MKKLTLLSLTLVLLVYNGAFSQIMHPYNTDFEEGVPGSMPVGWRLSNVYEKRGFSASLTADRPYQGKYCLELRRNLDSNNSEYGLVSQGIDITPYRGKTVRFRAAVRAEIHSTPGSAHLWLSERMYDNTVDFINRMAEQPIVINDWQVYEITGRVDEFSTVLYFGLMLKGTGYAWMDNASLEIVENSPLPSEPARPLTDAELKNISAFAGIFGYVRYYHPSEEAQLLDWDKFAAKGIKEVQPARNAKELSEILNKLYKPVAPSIQILPNGSIPPSVPPVQPQQNAMKNMALAWKHTGIKTGNSEGDVFNGQPVNVYRSPREHEGVVMQILNAASLRGKHVTFSASVKTNLIKPSGQAQLWIRLDGEDNRPLQAVTMFDRPITTTKWEKVSVEADVPVNATLIRLGLVTIGDGEAMFDDVELTSSDKEGLWKIGIKNPGFEEGDAGDRISFGWKLLPQSEGSGYSAIVSTNGSAEGKKCLLVSTEPGTRVVYPVPGQVISRKINDSISFALPLTVYSDSLHTLPRPEMHKDYLNSDTSAYLYNANDRTSRLAITTILWNVLKQFSFNESDESSWDTALSSALVKAAIDTGAGAFASTLRGMLPATNDGQARIWHEGEQFRYSLPFAMKWVANSLVITEIDPGSKSVEASGIKPGDIIISIDGVPAGIYFKNREASMAGVSDDLKKLKTIAELRYGDQGTGIRLKIRNSSGKESELSITRDSRSDNLFEKRLPPVSELKNGAFYIDLTRVTDKDFNSVKDSIGKAPAVIFDLRGLVLASEHLLGFFTTQNLKSVIWKIPVFTIPDKKPDAFRIITNEIKARDEYAGKKVYFLTDARTMGYGEAIAYLAKKYKIGEIVGMPTSGTIGEVTGLKLPAGYNMSITGIFGFDSDRNGDRMIFNKPVEPTIKAEPSLNGSLDGTDEILNRAMGLAGR